MGTINSTVRNATIKEWIQENVWDAIKARREKRRFIKIAGDAIKQKADLLNVEPVTSKDIDFPFQRGT